MARITITFGIILVLLGLGAYGYSVADDSRSVTALIPAFFGVPLLLLGAAATKWPARRGVVLHVAVLLALLGLAGTATAALSLPALITRPEEVARPAAVIVRTVMAVVSLVYIVLAVRSFVAARRKPA